MTQPVFRFAPSPNGPLHLGHAYSAMLNHDMAADAGARFLLRIEDIDTGRSQPEFERAIFHDLAWLGLDWEEPVRRQSEHFDDYRSALDALIDEELAYPAFMSRGEARAFVAEAEQDGAPWPRDPDGAPHAPPLDRERSSSERRQRMADGEPYAWRLDMAAALSRSGGKLDWLESGAGPDGEAGAVPTDPARWGDVVIARKDVPTSYHLSVVIDDALQGITHVVRGRDLFHATSVHRLLQELLGFAPPAYHHHRLLLDETGRKLSKSKGDGGLSALRLAGATPADVRRMVGL
ncbi:tRNA glutamyl-Q(34) synthetase GluQRS [Mesorhizobium sp. Z1-4]|uniref:tRNA glutamyl-Q(34) synthetase GluQRS n=1 Tax=Mesorhizobium sp. Z1-4 TaxID=2448478 RepID=UPI000FD7AFF3|nr:tRNA glutamyl-Q(34) synthetase GluQRS [Mesorhizobium sp. Z1-4]